MNELIATVIKDTATEWERNTDSAPQRNILFVLKVMDNLDLAGINPKQNPIEVQNALDAYFAK